MSGFLCKRKSDTNKIYEACLLGNREVSEINTKPITKRLQSIGCIFQKDTKKKTIKARPIMDISENSPVSRQSQTDGQDGSMQIGDTKLRADETIHADHRHDSTTRRLGRRAVAVSLIAVAVLFLYLIRFFFVPIILAATFTVLFYPLYSWIRKLFHGNRILSSICCCGVLVLGILAPIYGGVLVVGDQAVELLRDAEPQTRQVVRDFRADISRVPRIAKLAERLKVAHVDWKTPLNNSVASMGSTVTDLLARTSASMFKLVFELVCMLFIMFYLFVDGERILNRLRRISPLPHRYEDVIFNRFILVSRATVRGTLIIGFIQGLLGALTLLVFGIKSWLVWGIVMVIMSILPLLGAWMVLVPAGIIQIVLGHAWRGAGIILFGAVLVLIVDNLVRPRVVGQDAKLHDMLIFFSTIGGIGMFGPMGFIVGPVIAALFMAMIEIYGSEFGRHEPLKQSQ